MEKDTFDSSFFDQLKKDENNFFWFHVRRKWIFDKLKTFLPPPAKLLEVGCGTGNVSSFLAQKGFAVTGCDIFSEALAMAWPGFQKVQGDAANLPFEDNTFDIVGLFDVIEHFQDDIMPIKEAARVVRTGGIVAITVPAREELWSCIDEIAFHKRRYTKKLLNSVLLEAKLRPCVTDYMFMSLFIPMKYIRRKKTDISDSFAINRGLNLMLKTIFNTERLISKFVPLPIGTSLIAIVRKEP
jgi:ubiquinone/menaquinone biosynthesis C-methylase UbiE